MSEINLLVISQTDASHLKVLQTLPAGIHVTIGNSPEKLRADAANADVILNAGFTGEPFRSVWAHAPRLRWIHSLSAGVELMLSPELIASPIPLTNGKGVFKDSLGEFTLAAILFFAKDLRRMVRNQEAGRWEQFDIEMIAGKTLGIVGYGEIGQAAARLAHAVGMNVLALRRQATLSSGDGNVDQVYGPDQLKEMLKVSDYLLVAAPLTPQTRGMIGDRELRALQPHAVLINLGRGPVVVESALVEALREHRLRGAALDVFEREPLPAGHPFYEMKNVLLSPHTADHTIGWVDQAMHLFVENMKRFQAGQDLLNIVDKAHGY